MTSQLTCGLLPITLVNVNTIEFSITAQSSVNGLTPPTPDGIPMLPGPPPNTASMCGTLPGSTSVIVTSQRANMSFMHFTVSAHSCGDAFHAGTWRWLVMIDERFVRES